MAVLESTCYLCEQAVSVPVPADGHVFCCHGCRELWRLLGDDELAQLKSQPGVRWETVRQQAPPTLISTEGPAVRPESVTLDIDGMWCASCALLIEHVVMRTPGVIGARIDYSASVADIAIDRSQIQPDRLAQVVQQLGYGAKTHEEHNQGGPSRDQALVNRFGISLALSVFVMMFSVPIWSGYLPQLPVVFRDWLGYGLMALATPVLFWGGWPFLRGAWTSIRHRVPTMDLLIAIGTLSAYIYSVLSLLTGGRYLYFDTASMLVTFLLFSKLLEVSTRNQAGGIARLLSRFTVNQVRRLEVDGRTTMVSLDKVSPSDRLVILPGERLGVDAVIEEGWSALDESILTGEALPCDKGPGDTVYAGTVNHSGRLLVRTLRAPRESLLSQIQSYVKEAQESRGPWRMLADRILRIFVPVVLIIGLATLAVSRLAFNLPWAASLLRMTAVFVIACPCALSVATPLAIMAGAQRLGRAGVLIRSGDALERLALISLVAFDKTGTLTLGRMTVRDSWPEGPEVIQWAASAELGSEHPIAQALVRQAEKRGIPLLSGEPFETTPGFGISAVVAGRAVQVVRLDEGTELPPPLAEKTKAWLDQGYSVSLVKVGGEWFGAVALSDILREDAGSTVKQLKALGYRVAVLSGDHPEAVRRIAEEIGSDDFVGGMDPVQKAQWIEARQDQGERVLFVGDGINDSPALVKAELGMAMGQGSDIAREAGHLTLTRPAVGAVLEALSTGKTAAGVIRTNLLWAFIYNLLALPAAAVGVTSPLIAAAAMLVSSAFVLGNSLTILGWSPKRYVVGALSIAAAGALLVSLAWMGL